MSVGTTVSYIGGIFIMLVMASGWFIGIDGGTKVNHASGRSWTGHMVSPPAGGEVAVLG